MSAFSRRLPGAITFVAFTALLLAGCATHTPAGDHRPLPDPVLLVSIDAFRAGDLDSGLAPNLQQIARKGVHAQWMNPSYPSLTFPNHYTMVTGLYPDHHGIIHNDIDDVQLGHFSKSDYTTIADGRWWGGEPIWVAAAKSGLHTAAMFWPGTDTIIDGIRPEEWRRYDERMPANERVDTVLSWLARPPATRPRFTTLYFEDVDKAGHKYGPGSPESRAAIRRVDAAIGRLIDGLRAQRQLDRVNLVIVSDHGMAAVPPGHDISIEQILHGLPAEIVTTGQVVEIAPKPGQEATVEQALLGKHDHYACWRKSELPARWHYGTNPRIPAIVCQMDEGWNAASPEWTDEVPAGMHGKHGYDPALPSMRALFIARGPAFRQDMTIPAFDNVDVYPLLAHLLALPPAANDGTIAPLLPALANAPPP